MNKAKQIADRDIREYLKSIGKTYISVSTITLKRYIIFKHEILG